MIAKYEQYPDHKKQIIEIKALLFKLRNRSDFFNHIKKFSIMLPSGQKLNVSSGTSICHQLVEDGLLDSKRFNVVPEWRDIFSERAVAQDNPRREENLKIVQSFYAYSTSMSTHKKTMMTLKNDQGENFENKTLIHIAVYTNDTHFFKKSGNALEALSHQIELVRYLKEMYTFKAHFNLDWLATRSDLIKAYLCCIKLSGLFSETILALDLEAYLKFYRKSEFLSLNDDYLLYLLGQVDICLGDLIAAAKKMTMMSDHQSPYYLMSSATQLFFQLDYEQAGNLYAKALLAFKKLHRKRQWFVFDIHGGFYLLLLLFQEKKIMQASQYMVEALKGFEAFNFGFSNFALYDLLACLIILQTGDKNKATDMFEKLREDFSYGFYAAFYCLIQYALMPESLADDQVLKKIKKSHNKELKQGRLLAVQIYEELLGIAVEGYIGKHWISHTEFRFLNLIKVRESWEYTLLSLENAVLDAKSTLIEDESTLKLGMDKRLIWLLQPETLKIDLIEQRLGKKGWSKGRKISLKKMYFEESSFEYLTDQDKQAMLGLTESNEDYLLSWSYNNNHTYTFDLAKTLPHLIEHPAIYHMDNPSLRLDLIEAEPEVYVESEGHDFRITLSHHLSDENFQNGFILEKEGLHRYRVLFFNEDYRNVSSIIPEQGLTLPKVAKDRVLAIIQNAKKAIKIHSGIADLNIPEMSEDLTPLVQMLPIHESVQFTLWVKPFGKDQGPCCMAEHGKKDIIATISESKLEGTQEAQEVRKKVKRCFKSEKKAIDQLLSHCPSLASYHLENNIYLVESLEDILEVLSELEVLKMNQAVNVEWPQGEAYKIKHAISANNMSMQISSGHNWFEFQGEVKISDSQVLQIQAVLEGLKETGSRFIPLDNGEFVELTAALRKQLMLLDNISDGNKIYNLGSGVLADLAQEVDQLTVDTGWKAHLKQIRDMKKHVPKMPSTLQANLRDYQEDGFNYLSTLSHWGIGACLADDMGLGKTIQAITLILEYASKGATLVVAPTSVCFNWVDEFRKFAPTLNVYSIYEVSDVVEKVSTLTKMDVLVCSYGLLHTKGEFLAEKHWQTLILDEAQAIKNPNTKRWQAVMKLEGKVRVALTGTPIENHLGELWSISNFMNPGMLGSQKYFQKNFSIPIEVHKNADKMEALKVLMQPYILRRLKSDVLKELPPKIEQTIYIEPTDEERAFYEALRQSAVQKIASLPSDGHGGNQRIAILAEISKLRQACCDSSLVNDQISIKNSKLKHFRKMLNSILENGHKVLVFSQYVRFLEKVKSVLLEEAIDYQYIDGATPQAQRKKKVDAFQAGEGEVFLLSLKAGGSGLNLTAADYVIHLDPWWNPAVEDQASDRAHRIGQQRPVTIYRLVMKDSIEDKIIELHAVKRSLANDLLSGQEMSGKMTEDDLLNLISV